MTSLIPDGKTIRKQSDAALAAYIHHGHRLDVLTAARCTSTGDFPNVK